MAKCVRQLEWRHLALGLMMVVIGATVLTKLAETAQGAGLYWDTNGKGTGAGGSQPSGYWGGNNWSTKSDDSANSGTWVDDSDAKFAAGTDATGAYTVSVNNGATYIIHNITVEEGSVTIAPDTLGTGLLNENSAGTWTVAPSTLLNVTAKVNIGGTITLQNSGNTNGTINLSGNNTGAGGVNLNDLYLTLGINSSTALGTGTFTITLGTIDNTSGSAITLSNNNVQAWNGDFAFTGTNDLNLGTGAVTLQENRIVTVNGGRLTVGGIIGGAFTFAKSGAGTLALGGNNTYTKTTAVQGGTLLVNGTLSAADAYTVTPTVAGSTATLGGTGTIGLAANKQVSIIGAALSPNTLAILNPGNGGSSIGTLTITASGTPNGLLFGNLSELLIDINGANADRVSVTGNLSLPASGDTLYFNTVSAPTLGKYTILSYSGTKTDGGTTGFSTVSGTPSGYRLSYDNFNTSNGTIDLIQRAVILPAATPTYATLITGGSTSVGVIVTNNAQTNGDSLNQFTASAVGPVTGSSFSGGPLAPQASASNSGFTFNSTGQSLGVNNLSISVSSTDSGVTTPVSAPFTVTVLGHSVSSLRGIGGVLIEKDLDFSTDHTQLTVSVYNYGYSLLTQATMEQYDWSLSGSTAFKLVNWSAQTGIGSDPVTVTVQFDRSGLPVGTYNGTLTLFNRDDHDVVGFTNVDSLTINLSGESPVPEPLSVGLVALAVVGLGLYYRRRSRLAHSQAVGPSAPAPEAVEQAASV